MQLVEGVAAAAGAAVRVVATCGVAGTASAIIGAVSIMGGAILGAVIDRAFDGTVTPMITGFFLASLAALSTIFATERGRLFGDTSRGRRPPLDGECDHPLSHHAQ